MVTESSGSPMEWLNSFVPLGTLNDGTWNPVGAGVLLVDLPVVWLVTVGSVVDRIDPRAGAWVRRTHGHGLLDLTDGQAQTGVRWIRHPECDLAATLFPMEASFAIKAFAEVQCMRIADAQPFMPTVSVGCLYGPDIATPGYPEPAVAEGVVSRVDTAAKVLYTTAPLLPRNEGAPLLLASPYGGAVSLAGVLAGSLLVPEVDPRIPPVRLSVAFGTDLVMALIRGDDAVAQRERVSSLKRKTEK